MAEIIKLGSLFFGKRCQKVGGRYNGKQIVLGATIPGKELQWIKANGLLIADRCVCTNISWEQLDDQGLVFGTPIRIDEQFYLCRCLKVGAEQGSTNEWDGALNEIGKDNEAWHWEGAVFWGQETPSGLASSRAVRGCHSACHWNNRYAALRDVRVGFRPALEPLGAKPWNPETLIGKIIRLYGARGIPLEGHLLDVDDYDLILTPVASTPTDCFWASKAGENLVVGRDSVLWAKEV